MEKKHKPYLQLSTQSKQTQKKTKKQTRPLPSFWNILSTGGRYPSGILFCVNFCYPSTILCDSMLTNRQLSIKSGPMLLAQSGDAYNFPSHLFLSFTQLTLSVFTLSHARFCIHHFCWWDMRIWEDEGSTVKITKETKFTTICGLKCRPLIQLVFLKSEPAWKEAISQILPSLLEGFGKISVTGRLPEALDTAEVSVQEATWQVNLYFRATSQKMPLWLEDHRKPPWVQSYYHSKSTTTGEQVATS